MHNIGSEELERLLDEDGFGALLVGLEEVENLPPELKLGTGLKEARESDNRQEYAITLQKALHLLEKILDYQVNGSDEQKEHFPDEYFLPVYDAANAVTSKLPREITSYLPLLSGDYWNLPPHLSPGRGRF